MPKIQKRSSEEKLRESFFPVDESDVNYATTKEEKEKKEENYIGSIEKKPSKSITINDIKETVEKKI